MRSLVRLLLLVACGTAEVRSQEASRIALVAEPGLLTAAAVSAPEGATPLTAFFVRAFVLTRGDSARWRAVLGAGVTPFGFRGSGVRNQNAPNVFGGIQLELLPKRLTDGWIGAYVPLLFVYSYNGGSSDNTRLYGADVAAEGTVVLFLGSKLFTDLGAPWSRLAAYASMFQNLTPNRDLTTGERDRFRPDFMYGVSIPLAGSR
ncbi:MAG: hypothetical protein ACT4P6_05535 [Gemmatimonadaceae bacterium]